LDGTQNIRTKKLFETPRRTHVDSKPSFPTYSSSLS
jgi:hypothetical protein